MGCPSLDQYGGIITRCTEKHDTLPFTGLNLVAYLGIALWLIVVGVLLVRAGRRGQVL